MENENIKIGWQRLKLNDLGFIGRGKSKHRPRDDKSLFGGDYPFIQTADVKHVELYITKYNETYSEKGLQQSKLWKKGTLCITIAANISESGILMFDACFPDSIVGFIADEEKSNTKYVKYLLDTLKLHFQQISKGTTQDNLSLDKLLSIDFLVPPLDIQNKIADVLSAYDDLIENNNRRIEILEQTAQEIYKEWFVNFRYPGHETIKMIDSETDFGEIPEGWQVKRFEDFYSANYGKTLPKEKIKQTGSYPVYGAGGKIGFYDNSNIQKKVVLVTCRGNGSGTVWRTIDAQSFITNNSFIITSGNINFPFILEHLKVCNLNSAVSGSAQPQLTIDGLSNLSILVPRLDIIEQYNDFVYSIFCEIDICHSQNQNLIKSRNLLLPKLISGEIDVSKLKIK